MEAKEKYALQYYHRTTFSSRYSLIYFCEHLKASIAPQSHRQVQTIPTSLFEALDYDFLRLEGILLVANTSMEND